MYHLEIDDSLLHEHLFIVISYHCKAVSYIESVSITKFMLSQNFSRTPILCNKCYASF